MLNSGNTATVTSDDTAVTLLTLTAGCWNVTVINLGAVQGFVSVDGGTTWADLPAGPGTSRTIANVCAAPGATTAVKVKRIPGGTNLAGIWGDAQAVPPLSGQASVWYVRSTGSDSNTGLTVANAFLTAAQAFSVAQSGDTVNIQLGITYTAPPPGITVLSPQPNETV